MMQGWEEALREIVEERRRVVMILGAVDTGKTTLTAYLANELLKKGCSVGIVDADIGQSHIGPPTTIALGVPKEPFPTLDEVEPERMYFVGSTSPRGHLLPILTGTKLMVEEADTDFVLIDTTGLIRNAGLALKTHKIELVDPDIILALQRGKELEEVLAPFSFKRVLRLGVSSRVRVKGRGRRRALRERAFRKYFKDSKEIALDRGEVLMPLQKLKTEQLVGLADGKNHLLGLGIVLGENLEIVKILSPVEEGIKIIQAGSIRVSMEGKETNI